MLVNTRAILSKDFVIKVPVFPNEDFIDQESPKYLKYKYNHQEESAFLDLIFNMQSEQMMAAINTIAFRSISFRLLSHNLKVYNEKNKDISSSCIVTMRFSSPSSFVFEVENLDLDNIVYESQLIVLTPKEFERIANTSIEHYFVEEK